jgi:outer membrane lipoprotein-sorting protein
MTGFKLFAIAAMTVLAAAAPKAPLPEGEAVMDGVAKMMQEMKDVSCDVEVSTPARQASGNIVLQYVTLPAEKPGGEERTVRRYAVVTQVKLPEGTTTVRQVNDGETLWLERTDPETGEVQAIRQKVRGEGPVPGGFGPDWRSEMDQWRRKYSFATQRAGTFDGEPVVVVEGTLKTPMTEEEKKKSPSLLTPDRIILQVSTRDHFPRKADLITTSETTEDGKKKTASLVVSVRFRQVKLNAGLAADTFKYTPPAGAKVIDADAK